jgi:hypothetical protein
MLHRDLSAAPAPAAAPFGGRQRWLQSKNLAWCITLEGADGGRAIDHIQICAPKDRIAKVSYRRLRGVVAIFEASNEGTQIQRVMRQIMGPDIETAFGVKSRKPACLVI